MTVSDLPPLRESLSEHGLLAKKAFGQHFLLDLNITRKIARLAGPLEGKTVIEVGPGPGGLTRALLEAGAKVIAVEKDPRFLPLLAELSDAAAGALTVVEADALRVDEASLAGGPGLVISNLPYNVGTPLLIKWLTGPWRPQSMSLMFQKEVADRIAASVNDDAYGGHQPGHLSGQGGDGPSGQGLHPAPESGVRRRAAGPAGRSALGQPRGGAGKGDCGRLWPTTQDAALKPENPWRGGALRSRRHQSRCAC
jgi:hypothetical protein